MLKIEKRAFTLIELILVVALVIILAGVGVSSSSKAKNKAISKEAIANLKLIAAAERIYKMEDNAGAYVACSCNSAANCNNVTTGCNPLLKLNLNPTNWGYRVGDVSGTGAAAVATLTAFRPPSGPAVCTYTLSSGIGGVGFNNEPTPGSGC